MANKNAKRNDGIVTIVSLLLTILFIILSVISETKWIFIILAIISGLVLLVMLFGAMHLRSTKKPAKYVSFSSSSSYSSNSSNTKPKSALEQQIESELKYLSKEEQTYWKAYHDAQIKGYRFFQKSKTPLDWKERVWGQLTTYQQLHYLEVVKHDSDTLPPLIEVGASCSMTLTDQA